MTTFSRIMPSTRIKLLNVSFTTVSANGQVKNLIGTKSMKSKYRNEEYEK